MLISIAWFVLGLIFGSFSLVIITRYITGATFKTFGGRSQCDFCQKELSPIDLIPVLSFVFQGGKCRYCRKKLSLSYPLFEVIFGFLFVGVGLVSPDYQITLVNMLVVTGLVILAGIDWRTQDIVEPIVLIVAFLALISQILQGTSFLTIVYGIVAGSALFVLLVGVSRGRWMGAGDIEIGALLGLWLGFPLVLVALFMAFISGAVYGIYLIQTKQASLGAKVPFGPFLVLGGFIALFLGKNVLQWYLGGF
jgi:leader peptidase (prepilin peptidase)/N-methyltransferase